MALKFFPEIIILLNVDRFEEILNWNKIDEMVNDHLSSCNSQQFKQIYINIAKKSFTIFSHAYQLNH